MTEIVAKTKEFLQKSMAREDIGIDQGSHIRHV